MAPSHPCWGGAEAPSPLLSHAGLEGRCGGDASPVPPEQRCWGLAQLLGSQPSAGDQSSSSSVCTEDFAARWSPCCSPTRKMSPLGMPLLREMVLGRMSPCSLQGEDWMASGH